jgi:uncharacterized Zn finger protein
LSWIQRLIMTAAPQAWGEAIRRESENWLLRCPECGHGRSVWSAGGVRFKAASTRRKVWGYCPQCGQKRNLSLEYDEK